MARRGVLLLVVIAAPAQAQLALNTCDGAYARLTDIDSKCPPSTEFSLSAIGPQKTPTTCKTNACAAGLSAIDDSTLSLMKTGFTACGSLAEPKKSRAAFAETLNWLTFINLASMCGYPASIVKVTPHALTTCEGAYARFTDLESKCPPSTLFSSITDGPQKTPATCKTTTCAAGLSAIDDSTLSLMKTGFTACLAETDSRQSRAGYAQGLNYLTFVSIASQCGHAASIVVKVTPPALNTCLGASARRVAFEMQCPMWGTDPSAYRATCGNDACKAEISSIDDNTVSLMRTGWATCPPSPAPPFDYQFLIMTATICGHPASTVKVAGASLAWLLLYKFL